MPQGYIKLTVHRAAVEQMIKENKNYKEITTKSIENLRSQLAVEVARTQQLQKDFAALESIHDHCYKEKQELAESVRHYEGILDTIGMLLGFRYKR